MTDYSIKRFSKYTDDELIARVQDYAKQVERQFVSVAAFSAATGISEATVTNHFGTWHTFCAKAGLAPRYQRAASRAGLFDNLDRVWQALGRQPRNKEMKQPLSAISFSRYRKEFRASWYRICLEFLAYRSGASVSDIQQDTSLDATASIALPFRAARRGISLSLRYEVLKRDNFRCVKCGKSPALTQGVVLHVDHNRAWANGGETVISNLQTLCSDCNLGKSNKHDG